MHFVCIYIVLLIRLSKLIVVVFCNALLVSSEDKRKGSCINTSEVAVNITQ